MSNVRSRSFVILRQPIIITTAIIHANPAAISKRIPAASGIIERGASSSTGANAITGSANHSHIAIR